MSDYAEKLKHPKWQKTRLKILERDNFSCQLCMDENSMLVIHHKKYLKDSDPWDYPNDYLITLCSKCHDKFHGKNNYIKQIIPARDVSIKDSIEALRTKEQPPVMVHEFTQQMLEDAWDKFCDIKQVSENMPFSDAISKYSPELMNCYVVQYSVDTMSITENICTANYLLRFLRNELKNDKIVLKPVLYNNNTRINY